MAYKLLIVEDEKEKATGIAYLTGKYNPECRPVLLAHDGREGYEKAVAEKPDIIVTDIRMPEMDGLEMIRELKKAGCSAEFIVLSGYAEFSYAKKAIELGVRDFITKPVDEKELSETITRVCGEIATRRKTQDSLGKLNDDMRNYALRDFLTGGTDSRYKVGEFLKKMRVLENYSQYTCLVLAAENQEENILPVEGLILQGEQFLYSIHIGNAQTAVIIGANNFTTEDKKTLVGKYMIQNTEDAGRFSIGIGSTYKEYEDLPKAYEEACVAINYRILKGCGTAILFEELCNMENRPELLTEEETEQLKDRIDRFDQNGFRITVKGIFHRILSENTLTLPELQKLSLNIVLLGLHNIPTAQLQMNEYFGKNLFTLKSIEKFKTMEQLENWIMNMVSSVNEVMLKAIAEPRKELSKYAPKIATMQIDVDKIAEVIGTRGKVIKKIIEETNCEIDTEDDGKIFIKGTDPADMQRAMDMINAIVSDPEPGKIYKGTITRLMTFGAFVEIAPGKEGLVHISKMANKRVAKVEDVVAPGDEVMVKLTEIDKQGRLNFSMKDALVQDETPDSEKSVLERY